MYDNRMYAVPLPTTQQPVVSRAMPVAPPRYAVPQPLRGTPLPPAKQPIQWGQRPPVPNSQRSLTPPMQWGQRPPTPWSQRPPLPPRWGQSLPQPSPNSERFNQRGRPIPSQANLTGNQMNTWQQRLAGAQGAAVTNGNQSASMPQTNPTPNFLPKGQ